MATPSSQQSGDMAKAKTEDDQALTGRAESNANFDDKNKPTTDKTQTTSDNCRRSRAGSESDSDSIFDKIENRSRSSSIESSSLEDNPRALIIPIIDPNAEVVITPQVMAAAERLVTASALMHEDMVANQREVDRFIMRMEERLNELSLAIRDALLFGIEDHDEEEGSGQA